VLSFRWPAADTDPVRLAFRGASTRPRLAATVATVRLELPHRRGAMIPDDDGVQAAAA
jgi:hypothetical protein